MITIDPRVGSGDMLPYFAEYQIPAVHCQMRFGDAAFTGNGPKGTCLVGVEIKTIPDLISSITTGRYADTQLSGMKQMYDFVFLYVEGEHRRDKDGYLVVPRQGGWARQVCGNAFGAWRYRDFKGWLTTLQLRAKVIVDYTHNRRHSAHSIAELWQWFNQKTWAEHSSLKVFDESGGDFTLFSKDLPLLWAKDIPGIGWEKSQKVAARFKTGIHLANAPIKEWMEIEGIGPKIAKRAHNIIRGIK